MSNGHPTSLKFSVSELYCMSLSKFKIIRHIGDGAIGTVFLAKYRPSGHYYVLKLVEYQHYNTVIPGLDLSMELDHPNLMKCYGYFSEMMGNKKQIIVIMEYIKGQELFDIVVRRDREYRTRNMKTILQQITDGLLYLHRKGYVHQDIKLENIMLTYKNKIKIIDYDFLVDINNIYRNYRCGTPSYCSPEIIRKETPHRKNDLWALGVSMYSFLVGTYPFQGDNKKDLFNDILNTTPDFSNVPIEFRPIIEGLLHKDSTKRISLEQVSTMLKDMENT
jgi:serine/threonine protein kinase